MGKPNANPFGKGDFDEESIRSPNPRHVRPGRDGWMDGSWRGEWRVSGLKKERAGFARLNGEREGDHAGCDLVVGEVLTGNERQLRIENSNNYFGSTVLERAANAAALAAGWAPD